MCNNDSDEVIIDIESKLHKILEMTLKYCNEMWILENLFIEPRPKYTFSFRKLLWGKDLTKEQISAMVNKSQLFLLVDDADEPHAFIFADGFGKFRQKRII